MHAYALEALEGYLQPGDRCLDVGCGSGYRELLFFSRCASPSPGCGRPAIYDPDGAIRFGLAYTRMDLRTVVTAVISRLVGPDGLVVGIDHLEGLTRMTEVNLGKDGIHPSGPDENAGGGDDDSYTSVGGNRQGVKVVLGDGRSGFPLYGQFHSLIPRNTPHLIPSLSAEILAPLHSTVQSHPRRSRLPRDPPSTTCPTRKPGHDVHPRRDRSTGDQARQQR